MDFEIGKYCCASKIYIDNVRIVDVMTVDGDYYTTDVHYVS